MIPGHSLQDNIPAILTISSRDKIRIKQLTIRANMLCLVTSGTKYLLKNETNRLRYSTDSLLMFHQGSVIDIINEPPFGAPYQATVISLSTDYLQSFSYRHRHVLVTMPFVSNIRTSIFKKDVTSIPSNMVLQEIFLRTVTSIQNFHDYNQPLNPLIYIHRLDELLLMLASLEYQFQTNSKLTMSEKIFRLLGHQLHKNWTKISVARALNMSESTLDRGLKLEQLNFGSLLRTIRLEHAMSLLLAGHLAIGEVAVASGYQSHGRFSQAFHKHFGVLPSSIR